MYYIVLTTFSILGLDVCDEGDEDSAGLMEYRSFCYPCILKAMIGWN